MRIAVPVEADKSTIARKTGESEFFVIYEDEKVIDYIPSRNARGHRHAPGNGQGLGRQGNGQGSGRGLGQGNRDRNGEALGRAHRNNGVATIEACDTMLVQVIGENMKASFKAMGIEVKKVRQKDGNTADEVVKNFLNKNI